jgi:hypothetical protein
LIEPVHDPEKTAIFVRPSSKTDGQFTANSGQTPMKSEVHNCPTIQRHEPAAGSFG